MLRRGFTIVELIITITIMGILLVLAVVNVNASQERARDDERKADVEAIASGFERFYEVGSVEDGFAPGSYPSVATSAGTNASILALTLRDGDIKSLLAPGITNSATKSLISATNATQTTTGVLPQPSFAQYVYQPIQGTGALCTAVAQGCRKFNIYYRLEADNTVYRITSRNQ